MRLLLDTHVALWWLTDDRRLSAVARGAIATGRNTVLLSAISIAEIEIKRSLGKLEAPDGLAGALASEGFTELPFTADHAAELSSLPWHHRDPFDRMLVAQARVEGLTLVTADARIDDYDVHVLR